MLDDLIKFITDIIYTAVTLGGVVLGAHAIHTQDWGLLLGAVLVAALGIGYITNFIKLK